MILLILNRIRCITPIIFGFLACYSFAFTLSVENEALDKRNVTRLLTDFKSNNSSDCNNENLASKGNKSMHKIDLAVDNALRACLLQPTKSTIKMAYSAAQARTDKLPNMTAPENQVTCKSSIDQIIAICPYTASVILKS